MADEFENNSVYFSPDIPEKKALRAIKNMNLDIDVDDIVMLYDSSESGDGGEGFILTGDFICGKEAPTDPFIFDLDDIEDVDYDKDILLINDEELCLLTNIKNSQYDGFVDLITDTINAILDDDDEEDDDDDDEEYDEDEEDDDDF